MSACRSCGAPIRWARTVNRKAIPLDPTPTADGNVRVDPDGTAHVLGGDDLDFARQTGERLLLAHHASCPQGREWKRRTPTPEGNQP